jgi:hypothetical protein
LIEPARGIATRQLGADGLLVAGPAVEGRADPLLSPLGREHPGALLPRGSVADVPEVAAFEECHPVPHLVLLEGDDGAPHC